MKLFDEIKRNDHEPALYADSTFAFLNRSNRVFIDRIRNEIENWYSHYPTSDQEELRVRFRSDINSQHQSAFFELFLHELLLRLGCKITLHPSLSKVTRTPDFLVEPPNDERFYLEAILATNESSAEAAAHARENAVYDVLNRELYSSDFYLSLTIVGAPETPPPAKKLASFLNANLAKLDPDEITKLYELGETNGIPIWQFNHDEWSIEFKPIPKKPKARRKSGVRPIGVISTGVQCVDHRTPIKNAITKKAGKYGEFDLPYVVAVNVLEDVDDIDIMEALFGKEQFTVTIPNRCHTDSQDTKMSRLPDGAWIGPKGPRNTRVSAVLLITQLFAWNIPRADLRLYHNPWAKKPYHSVLTQLPQSVLRENHMVHVDGKSTNVIFGTALSPQETDY